MKERTFRYVRCTDLEAWLRAGWLVVGHYRSFGSSFDSFILEWKCTCPLGVPLTGGQKSPILGPMIAPTTETSPLVP